MTPPLAEHVLLIGLGSVAQTHLTVLQDLPCADVIGAVDSDPSKRLCFRGLDRPVYPSVREASEGHSPGIVVIATPTPTHAAVCDEVSRYLPQARLLVEKPAAANLADARHVLTDIGGRQPVDVAYHMAFSPEVTWGLAAIAARETSAGELLSAELFFSDPYYDDFDRATSTLSNSWLDSSINALSVLSQFTQVTGRRSLRRLGTEHQSVFEGRLTCRTGSQPLNALIVTSWHVTDAAKTTRLRYSSGIELLMDHTAVAAYLYRDGTIEDFFGADRSIPRRERHYRALYQRWLTEGKPTIPATTSMELHELLLG